MWYVYDNFVVTIYHYRYLSLDFICHNINSFQMLIVIKELLSYVGNGDFFKILDIEGQGKSRHEEFEKKGSTPLQSTLNSFHLMISLKSKIWLITTSTIHDQYMNVAFHYSTICSFSLHFTKNGLRNYHTTFFCKTFHLICSSHCTRGYDSL